MIRTTIFSILLLCIYSVNAQSRDEQSVRDVLMKITNAMKKHDLKTLDQIYASDFVFVNGRGKKFNRSERMENLKTTPAPEEFAFSNEKIRVHGNVAIVNGEVNVRTKGVAPVHDYVTLIFLKSNGQWHEISAQGTDVH
jgi:ketosteroid isomerase-like protein